VAAGSVTEVVERRGDLEVVQLGGFDRLGADVVVTTRVGGVSDPPYDSCNLGDHVGDDPTRVAENRRRLAAAMGVAPERLRLARQVHGAGVAVVDAAHVAGEADALVTNDAAVAIGVLVADCVPVVVLDPTARVLAVAHAGWRGTVAAVVATTLDAMAECGASRARCHAAIGPCISGDAYQVGQDVADALRIAGLADAVRPDGNGRFLADLPAAVRSQLTAAGVPAEHVATPRSFTDDGARYFSDRAQRPCGRFALAARLQGAGS
jgi:YfiH family protein